MYFSVTGIDHRSSTAIREKAAFSDTRKIEFAAILAEHGFEETVVLSTCNRSEVYAFAREEPKPPVRQLYAAYFDIPDGEEIYMLTGKSAFRHCFRVAAGLESAILGEDEILRQVKADYELAKEFRNTGKYLNRLFQEAIRCAKEIKSSLKISEIPVSPGYIGLKLLQREVGDFSGKNLLLMGFGEIGQLFYEYSRDYDFNKVRICNRSEDKVWAAVGHEGYEYYPFSLWPELLPDSDVAVIATNCPHLILKKEQMLPRIKPLSILDMSMPRNVEASIGELDHYSLFDIDALSTVANENNAARRNLAQKAEVIIDVYEEAYDNWLDHAGEDAVIESLNQSVDGIMESHLTYLFHKIQANDKEKAIITRTMQAAMKKVTMTPIVALKNMPDKEKRQIYSEVIEELFRLK